MNIFIDFHHYLVNFGWFLESSGLETEVRSTPNFNGSYLGHQEELEAKQKILSISCVCRID